ncbi:MAG: hypothetical protein ABFS37_11825, partial [Acidobacteriota bacterium]
IGIGAYTFHPPPKEFDQEIRKLNQREQEIREAGQSDEWTAEERDEIESIRLQRSELRIEKQEALKPWSFSTSIILILFSTLLLAVSLLGVERLQVVSNGLLLGGVFTMLYGIGWIAFTGTSIPRFLVMTVALVVTLVLGYWRFVRQGRRSTTPDFETRELENIERRLQDLEERLDRAAQALGTGEG